MPEEKKEDVVTDANPDKEEASDKKEEKQSGKTDWRAEFFKTKKDYDKLSEEKSALEKRLDQSDETVKNNSKLVEELMATLGQKKEGKKSGDDEKPFDWDNWNPFVDDAQDSPKQEEKEKPDTDVVKREDLKSVLTQFKKEIWQERELADGLKDIAPKIAKLFPGDNQTAAEALELCKKVAIDKGITPGDAFIITCHNLIVERESIDANAKGAESGKAAAIADAAKLGLDTSVFGSEESQLIDGRYKKQTIKRPDGTTSTALIDVVAQDEEVAAIVRDHKDRFVENPE